MNKEQEQNMTVRELRLHLLITQAIIITLSVLLSYMLFHDVSKLYSLFVWDPIVILIGGGGIAGCIVLVDLVATKLLPEEWMDDGGINDRIFRGISVPYLFMLTLCIGFSEELLFRGILQTKFGIVASSIIFAVLHVRYLKKPFLFFFVLLISVSFGCLFVYTGNLLVPIFAHFLVDFIMGLHLRKVTEGEEDV
ncbi:CPBP family intramembrane glutamic endopeptidase [Ectobacillus polymachus]|uniref:CPBP family intramembrane glutamic endopeptidase n=1 Tax=Ectobacillus polymachus TaxID=1508806 RepID=UPI003A8916E3